MKSILSLWALLCLIYSCESMDRYRNKMCYNAMTCIHTGKEKCGVDGGGNYRRFYDSCDILEFNCLKGKNYVKTPKENCQNLPPIDDEAQDERGTNNNVVTHYGHDVKKENDVENTGNANDNDKGVEGAINIHENGDMEGEVIINDDKILEQTPNNEKAIVDDTELNQENTGVEGKIEMDENGGIEGDVVVNDDIFENIGLQIESTVDNPATGDQQIKNKDEAIEGEIKLDDEGGVEVELQVDDGAMKNIGENNADDAIEENPRVLEETAINEGVTGIEGMVILDDEGNIEGEIKLGDEQAAVAETGALNQDVDEETVGVGEKMQLNQDADDEPVESAEI